MLEDAVQRVDHVTVTDVPGRPTAADHGAVSAFGVGGDRRVLLGLEAGLGIVTDHAGVLLQPGEQGHELVLAGCRHDPCGPGVLLGVLCVRFEAAPRTPRRQRGLRVVDVEEIDDDA